MKKYNLKIALISNITFEPFFSKSAKQYFSQYDLDIMLSYIEYANLNNLISQLCDFDIIAVCLNLEELYHNSVNSVLLNKISRERIIKEVTSTCKQLYSTIREVSSAQIVWFNFEDYGYKYNNVFGNTYKVSSIVDKINMVLSDDVLSDTVCIDFKHLIAQIGICKSYSNKNKYRWNSPYSEELIDLMTKEIYKQYQIHTSKTKKCIVLDCDNVLWGGILSEAGIEGIQIECNGLGRQFYDFQNFLVILNHFGVILAVCSKNYEEDVLKVFREHSGMLLSEENISCFKCNWEDKPSNIKEISDILNIGLNSIVFVDDSVFEINSVNAILPEVTTVLYNRDTIFDKLSYFNLSQNIDINSVRQRNDTYRTNVNRTELKKICSTQREFLQSLNTKIDIHTTMLDEIARISELSQRTNKCTNGVRYTVDKLKCLIKERGYSLYSIFVSDKFSNLGLVGAIGVNNNKLDLFCLSCRALGREIEKIMLDHIKKNNVKNFIFYSTGKNDDLKSLFERSKLVLEIDCLKQ